MAGWLPANPGNISTASSDCMGESQRQYVVFHCLWPDVSTTQLVVTEVSSQQYLLGLRVIAFRDLLCHDQGLFPSPGPSPINPHPRCGPQSIGLVSLHLLGATSLVDLRRACLVAPPWCDGLVALRRCTSLVLRFVASLARDVLGLMNQMNVVAINLCSQLQSSPISFHNLTCFTGLDDKLVALKKSEVRS